jgi:hypothetical protein
MGYLVLLGILSWIVTTLPLTIIQFVLTAALPLDNIGLVSGISAGLSSIFTVLWQPLNVAAVVLLYYDLRVRKEGYDLALRVERLEAEVSPPNVEAPEPPLLPPGTEPEAPV